MQRHATIVAAVTALLLIAGAAVPVLAAEEGRFLRIEVTESGHEQATVKVKLPLSLIELMLDAVQVDEPGVSVSQGTLKVDGRSIDVRKMIETLKSMPKTEFLTVEHEDGSVRIWLE